MESIGPSIYRAKIWAVRSHDTVISAEFPSCLELLWGRAFLCSFLAAPRNEGYVWCVCVGLGSEALPWWVTGAIPS